MKRSRIFLSTIAFLTLGALMMPSVFAQESVGFRLGYNWFTGERKDDFIFRSAFNLEFDPDTRDFEFVDNSLPSPMDMDASGLMFGAEGNIPLPMIHPRLLVSPVLEYYQKKNINYPIDAAALEWAGVEPDMLTYIQNDLANYKLLSFMANIKYLILEEEYYKIVPYVGGGLGFHYWKVDVERVYFGGTVDYEAPDIEFINTTRYTRNSSDTGWSFGAQILGGIGYNLHPRFEPFLELQYRFMQRAEARIFSGQIDEEIMKPSFNGLQFLGGIRYKF